MADIILINFLMTEQEFEVITTIFTFLLVVAAIHVEAKMQKQKRKAKNMHEHKPVNILKRVK